MKVIIKEPGKPGYVKDMQLTIKALQAEVGGYIEFVHLNSRLMAIVNRDGRRANLEENICGLFGTVVLCGKNGVAVTDIDPRQVQLLTDGGGKG